jgi:predicted nucleotide-binding protein
MLTIRELLDFLAEEDLDIVRRLGEIRDLGGRGRAAKCESLARSYRGDHEQFFSDLRKQDLVVLLESPTEIRGSDFYLPSAGRYAREALETFATQLFRDEIIPEGFERGGLGSGRPTKRGLGRAVHNETSGQAGSGHATDRLRADAPTSVFIVHGHDEVARLKVQNFLHKLRLDPIVLHDERNQGRAIIEKLEREAQRAQFAIVLLSPDDKGCRRADDTFNPRARQNIIFEWGLFVGLLGRDKVCALCTGSVEMPSDVNGIAWESMEGHWEARVAKEMQAAGLRVDLNLL